MIWGKRKLVLVLRPCKFFLFISPGSRTVMSDEGDLSLVPRSSSAKRWYIVGSKNFSCTVGSGYEIRRTYYGEDLNLSFFLSMKR